MESLDSDDVRDWHQRVYRRNTKVRKLHRQLPPGNESLIRRRYNYRCAGCGSCERTEIHHIIPREEDGTSDPGNLILLCCDCHDYVECHDSRPRSENMVIAVATEGYYKRIGIPSVRLTPLLIIVSDDEPDWHTWVYGGGSNPYNDPAFIEARYRAATKWGMVGRIAAANALRKLGFNV